MPLLSLSFNVEGKRCLIIGGGPVAFRRAQSLARAGALFEVISPQIQPEFGRWLSEVPAHYQQRLAGPDDVDAGLTLVVTATNDREVNQAIAAAARRLQVLVNVADDAPGCDVTFPSVLHRSPIQIAVSSGSASPILSRMLMRKLSTVIPSGYGKLADLVGRYRKQAVNQYPDIAQRRHFWEQMLSGAVAESVFSGRADEAEQLLKQALATPMSEKPCGEVYLIGAGPGDPDLLTIRAVRLLNQAQVIVYDRLVSPEILAMFGENQEMRYVGKQRADHAVAQPDINQILIELAQQGKRVARLKGGDPFIFGRGGEEIEALAARQIPFQVIPGITAAAGCASYSGIPLTHRDYAQSVRFVTGQLKDGTVDLNWESLIDSGQTLVFYMGLHGFAIICENLIKHGLGPLTPVALIEKGTTLEQKVHIADLQSMPQYLSQHSIASPSLFIVGEVVNLHQKLAWFGV